MPRKSTILSYRPGNAGYVTTAATERTVANLHNLEAPPTRVRLVCFNPFDSACSIDAAAVAPTSQVADGFSPVGPVGYVDHGLWRRVTFEDAARAGNAVASTASSGGFTMPPNSNSQRQPRLAFSDWVSIDGLERSDGGQGSLLLVRIFTKQRIALSSAAPMDAEVKRNIAGFEGPSDGVSAPTNWAGAPRPVSATFGLQYETRQEGITVIGIGDSISSSLRTTGGMSGFGIRAASSLSSAAFPVSYVNDAVSGRTTADTFADGANHIRMLNPDVAVIQCWSENDGAWEKPARAALDRTKELVEIAAAAGCAPILCTAAPVFAHRPDIEKARDWSNNQVRSWSESGIAMLDLDRLWSNGAIPAAYRPEFNSGDDRHPNDHACAVAGVALANLLRRLYSL